jgi:hypothetical protein
LPAEFPYTISNVMTALIETEGKLLVFLDRLEPTIDSNGQTKIGKVTRELQAELHFSPQQYKAVAELILSATEVGSLRSPHYRHDKSGEDFRGARD